ncbi:leucine-rich repeat domain-containing protein [Colwellia ponticola]|uniref:NACHT domain-containing protein n=1 Tax=Colwellia ponticola TaxID=2304625 RepID=A0A8H2JJ66_9GAMM|nr:leucine-rich repeat domain-containing protein [Colwellia ponticola]TMM42009.1 NACHT domain-containing protein [Colwellia ponticola]
MGDSFKKSEEWCALLELLRQGQKNTTFQPILWVGAGLSVPAGYPTTDQLIGLLKDNSVKPLPNFVPNDITFPLESVNRSFTLWIQNFAQINGYGRLNKALSSIFLPLPNEPTSTHLALTTNLWKNIFTTNYDQLLESALDRNKINFNLVTQEDNCGLEQNDFISLYKIHGGVTNIREWTLDEQSYLNFSDKYPFLDAKLKATLLAHSIVYVGCSMVDPRVIEWYQYCADKKLSSQLEYSIVIIRESAWESLPEELQQLYLRSNIHPLFFENFDELPLLFSEVNNELNNTNIEKVSKVELSILDVEQRKEREKQILDDLLYETVSPCMIDIIASIWLEVPKNTQYTDHLKAIGGAKTKNQGEIAFKSLLDDFVELSKKLIGTKLEFKSKEKVFLLLNSVLKKHFPTHLSLERIDYNPHTLYGSLHLHTTEEESIYNDEIISNAFSNILKEFCELIIDCSNALPSWTKENLYAQLNEHEPLFKNLREELGRWKESSSSEVDEVVLIEDEFRRAIARRFDELKIFGLSFGKRTRKYQLSVAYISLTTETDFNNSEDNKVMSTNEALTCYTRLVILGEAGQGKTTLLQWLTVQCGRRSFGSDQADFNKKVPVLIQLRSILNESCLPDELDFYAFMTEGIEIEKTHTEWIGNILENKLAIIMIDGFDEVPKERRQEVLDWIEILCERYNGNQFILTSRPSAYENTSLEHLDFNVIQLQTMDRKAQSDFVEHWHHAIALEYDKTKPDALHQQAVSLLEKLRQQKVLRNLAQNPLLCGVLCMLHHDRNGYLPKDRTDLYESTCRLFLDSRDREKKVIETDKFTLLDLRNKESLLSDIAFWMTNNGKTSISPDILKQRLKSKSKDMPELWRYISAEELELFFLERSGLLVQVGLNEIQFTHRTFQEFYTAKYIISENDTECLSKNAGNDYWNGTIQLAIGLRTSKIENEKYLTELLSKAKDFESDHDLNSATSLYLLVLSCKENMREITPRFSYQLKEVIKKVVPPPTAKARDALASAGNIAIPYLARPKGGRSIIKDHYCALALIKIATPDAYIMLKDYFKDNRISYIRKLCTDIKKMDCEVAKESNLIEAILADGINSYDQSIRVMLSFLTQEKSLLEDGINQGDLFGYERKWKFSQGLAPLAKLDEDEIVQLDLSSCSYTDLDIINKFSKLEVIDLSNSIIDRLPSFINSPIINILNLNGVRIRHLNSLSELRKLTKLKNLDISNTNIDDISPISDLTMLENLNLEYTGIVDVSPLANLTKLKKLNACLLSFDDFNVLSGLSELISLDLSYCSISHMDSSPLANLVNLRNLNLCYSDISDIKFLENLHLLNELDLSQNSIVDISALNNLDTLTKLNLSQNSIVDISALNSLDALTKLDLSQNSIVDISVLNNFSELTNLKLSENKITDVSALDKLKKLRRLDLSNNDVINIQFLSTLTEMRVIDLSNTKVDSLGALENLDKLTFLKLSNLKNIDYKPIMHHSNIRHIQVGYLASKDIDKKYFKSKPYIF